MKIGLRIWILIIVLFLAALAIIPLNIFEKGVLVKSVELNSTAFESGLRQGQIITSIDGNKITDINGFSEIIFEKNYSNLSGDIKTIILTNEGEFVVFSDKSPEITVSDIPRTKIKTGLDLSGGSRALIKAKDKELSSSEVNDLVDVISNRLNVYGIADVKVSPVSDSPFKGGKNFISIEIAGATPTDLKELISSQGKFEAKIGNQTVFIGGEKDIASVSRGGQEALIESCDQINNGYACRFRFSITLSPEAAQRHADITKNISINATNPEYLSKTLDLYVDDKLQTSLQIGKDLKGRVTTQVSISGSEIGDTKDEAEKSAKSEMKKLQTILVTGSLPYQLEIVKLDTISPSLGESFTKNIIYLGLIVFFIISAILFVKYRKIKITLSVILTMFSEAFITLGIAALISWNLDAPGIAGIIAGMGTGVNDQIVILDESISNVSVSLKERIKNAFFIIVGAFFTIVASMVPLFWAGAGMLKGFALTTIIGVTVGILITRPAFAEIVRRIGE